MSKEKIEMTHEQLELLVRVSGLLGEGWKFYRVMPYMGDGVQINWKSVNSRGSVMWREVMGDYVEYYDASKSMHVEVLSFEELRVLRGV